MGTRVSESLRGPPRTPLTTLAQRPFVDIATLAERGRTGGTVDDLAADRVCLACRL